MRDYYLELSVTPMDTKEKIQVTYRSNSRKMRELPEKTQRAIVEALKVLSDDDARKEYDAQPQFQFKKSSPRLTAAGTKKKSGEKVPFRWGVPLMEIIMMPFKKEEETNIVSPEELAGSHFTQGVLYAADPNGMEKAKEEFKTVLSSVPDLKEAQYNYAVSCYKLGQYKEAVEAFRKCLDLDAKDILAKKMLSMLE